MRPSTSPRPLSSARASARALALGLGAVLLLPSLAGCGDDLGPGPGARPDGGATDGDSGADPGGDLATVFAVATDFFSTGVASTVAVPELAVEVGAVAGVASTDPVARHLGGRLYIINRFGQDNVTILDADTLQLVGQISTGVGSNPQDVAADGDRVYVATMGGVGVAVLDASDPDAGVVDTIDLSLLDTADDVPNCHTLALRGRHLLVACGILDEETFQPRSPGRAVVIDLESEEITDVFPLAHERPFGFGLAVPEESALDAHVLLPSAPSFADPDAVGCVESVTIDAADGTAAAGCLIDNADLGGYVSALAYEPGGDRIWMTVTSGFDPDDFGPRGHLVAYQAADGILAQPVTGAEDRPMDVAVCPTGHLVVSEVGAGVRVFSPGAESELTEAPLDLGLPPVANGLTCF